MSDKTVRSTVQREGILLDGKVRIDPATVPPEVREEVIDLLAQFISRVNNGRAD